MTSPESQFPFLGYFDGSFRRKTNHAGIGAYLINADQKVLWGCEVEILRY